MFGVRLPVYVETRFQRDGPLRRMAAVEFPLGIVIFQAGAGLRRFRSQDEEFTLGRLDFLQDAAFDDALVHVRTAGATSGTLYRHINFAMSKNYVMRV